MARKVDVAYEVVPGYAVDRQNGEIVDFANHFVVLKYDNKHTTHLRQTLLLDHCVTFETTQALEMLSAIRSRIKLRHRVNQLMLDGHCSLDVSDGDLVDRVFLVVDDHTTANHGHAQSLCMRESVLRFYQGHPEKFTIHPESACEILGHASYTCRPMTKIQRHFYDLVVQGRASSNLPCMCVAQHKSDGLVVVGDLTPRSDMHAPSLDGYLATGTLLRPEHGLLYASSCANLPWTQSNPAQSCPGLDLGCDFEMRVSAIRAQCLTDRSGQRPRVGTSVVPVEASSVLVAGVSWSETSQYDPTIIFHDHVTRVVVRHELPVIDDNPMGKTVRLSRALVPASAKDVFVQCHNVEFPEELNSSMHVMHCCPPSNINSWSFPDRPAFRLAIHSVYPIHNDCAESIANKFKTVFVRFPGLIRGLGWGSCEFDADIQLYRCSMLRPERYEIYEPPPHCSHPARFIVMDG
jgi:hypothetical protein